MVQVNLIGKKRKERSKRNWILISMVALFAAIVFYFVGATIYVVANFYRINKETKEVDDEAVAISQVITANKEALSRFVLSKFILDRVGILKRDRFRYKDYLDQIAKLMPANAVLTNVDFALKGWVAVSASFPNTSSLKEFESNFTSESRLSQTEFASVFSESVISDKNGFYNAKLHFELKKNGRK